MSVLVQAQADVQQIVELAAEQGVVLRLLGGLAVRLHSPSATHRSLVRSYADFDFVMADRRGDRIAAAVAELGYLPNQSFNLLNGDRRLLFYDESGERQIDIFVNTFHMCHSIPIVAERLALEPVTLPLAELLLTKMQIVQLNEKDVRDLCALVLDHSFGEGDDETFNLPYIAGLCARDWGLWKTITTNAQKVRDFADAYDLDGGQKLTITERLDVLRSTLDETPKSLKWKARDRIGERVQWYDLPEEVQRG
jgi:hypothetical protein